MNILTKQVWVIMDKSRQMIVQTATKNSGKFLTNIKDPKDTRLSLRLLTYDTEGRAIAGLRDSHFQWKEDLFELFPELKKGEPVDRNRTPQYYNEKFSTMMEVVKVDMSINLKEI